jgi:hypothetical protein
MKPQGAWKSVGTHYTTMKKERMRVLGCGFFLISKAYAYLNL